MMERDSTMPLTYVSGDPLLTRMNALAFGHNARGRSEQGPLHIALQQQFPAAFASYTRQCRQSRLKSGDYWIWHDSQLILIFMIVRESSVSATRLRDVQSVALKLSRDYQQEGLARVAIAPIGSELEWPEVKLVLENWLPQSKLVSVVYDRYIPGEHPNETE